MSDFLQRNLYFLALAIWGCGVAFVWPVPGGRAAERPRNVILIIGDGMGLTQLTAARFSRRKPMHFERMQVVGLVKTHSADNLITDSAAGATAFACGCKTYNHAVGVDSLGRPCRSLFEEMEARGGCTGVVVTSAVTHATPAAFLAHEAHRTRYFHIAADIVHSGVDYLVGGGLKYFVEREDGADLKDSLRWQGVKVRTFKDGPLSWSQMRRASRFAWFAAWNHPSAAETGRNWLARATTLGARFLSTCAGGQGFVLMIEGSQIDWGGHANDLHFTVREIEDLDQAIGAALDFAEADGHTLVLVTADHETGGMSIPPPSRMGHLVEAFSTNSHTATMVPLLAWGPGAAAFGGIMDNTEVHARLRRLLGW